MDKIEYINNYIERCNSIIDKNDAHSADLLADEIIGVFSSEIEDITGKLDAYGYGNRTNYIGDIKLLKQKLINYQLNLFEEQKKRTYNLELARLKQPKITNYAESKQSQVQNTSINIAITIEQTLKKIDEIQKESLTDNDKDKLKDYLYSLEGIKSSKDKNKFWDKTKEVLKFLADKGADAAIAMLPYIIQGLSTLN